MAKKRYIGNDLCVIIFRDSDCDVGEEALDPTTFKTQFNRTISSLVIVVG